MVKYMKKNVPLYVNHQLFGQISKSSSTMLFKLNIVSWCPLLLCYVLKYIEYQDKIFITNITYQKAMINVGFGHTFHGLKYF